MPARQDIYMCRIAGIISNKFTEAQLKEKGLAMCATLAHGGPDDEGVYCDADAGLMFGHRRLSIIDLSTRGHQPMANPAGSIWITFNGEIYNYIELREELILLGCKFNTATDTEVIIQAYQHWGEAAFAKLNGMFAFALYNQETAQTYLVRDSGGIKPLYYSANNTELFFASETRTFADTGLVTQPDKNWPIRFLAFGHIQEPYTTLNNVYSLPKGCYLLWENKSCTFGIKQYHHTTTTPVNRSISQVKTELRQVIDDAVSRQLIADAPIGVFLSGGTDSSLITLRAAAFTAEDQLKTISIYFNESQYNERQYQEQLLEQTHAKDHQHLVTRKEFEEALPSILADMDTPTTDGVNSWFISKYARQSGLKAVLSGLGADELFGGYPSFNRIKYLKYLKLIPGIFLRLIAGITAIRPLKRLEFLSYKQPVAEYLCLRGLFTPSEIAKLLHIDKKRVVSVLFSDHVDPGTSNNKLRAAWFETNMYMQNQLLRDTDVMSMAHGLEVRVPFLDENVQQMVDTIPPDLRFDQARPKGLLINSYTDVLPKAIYDRPKMGFSFPLQQWMRQHTEIANPNFYQNPTAQKVINKFAAGKDHWSRAFTLYQLEKQQSRQLAHKKVLLLTLVAFSNTGGIQKMCRTMAYSMQKIADRTKWDYTLWSGYDTAEQLVKNYTQPQNYRGFKKRRMRFVWDAVRKGLQCDVVVLTHINMALIGWLIKKRNPNVKVWVICHGIEVWRTLPFIKQRILAVCDKVVCVSQFTADKMATLHGVKNSQLAVLNNAIDPFLKPPNEFKKPQYLLDRYGLSADCKIIFTLTRLASTEQYKGYEQVIKAVSKLKTDSPNIRYVLSGKYDDIEYARIKALIAAEDVERQIIITGFIAEKELEDHFLLADLFVLPSKKEGFGIVFIEAMACGLPVICGNEDGSVDAIKNGELGIAVNTEDVTELTEAISKYFNAPLTEPQRRDLQQKCIGYFNADVYTDKLQQMLANS